MSIARDSDYSGEFAPAKGRIERHHGTHQDRLIKKLRRHGIADLASANAFLEQAYWADHNRRFAQAPASTDDFHLPLPRGVSLDRVFRLEHTRTVSNDWVVRYDNRVFQIARQSHRPPARSTVQIYEAVDGRIEIRYRDRGIRHQEIAAESLHAQRTRQPSAWQPPATITVPSKGPSSRTSRPRADHPWRRGYDQHLLRRARARAAAAQQPMEAAGAVDAQIASTAPWKTTEPFSTAPTGDSC